jgi:hypothetical protein
MRVEIGLALLIAAVGLLTVIAVMRVAIDNVSLRILAALLAVVAIGGAHAPHAVSAP